MKHRTIWWVLLPTLFAVLFFRGLQVTDFQTLWQSFLLNLSFIVIQLLAVTVWFSLKNRALVNITKNHLGWGDILFFAVSALVFSPVNFLLFYIISLTLILTGFLLYKAFRPQAKQIPLAGGMAAILMVCCIAGDFSKSMNFYDDNSILLMMNLLN
ncbi:MAG: hypothetical protein COA57_04890 [Flavobacteriales bacterium]|nr:MAG: hypothetical protein COA57_04890 [Flavobacteriales bacterium]